MTENKKDLKAIEIIVFISAFIVGILGYLAYKGNPIIYHQFPLFKIF